MCKIFGIYLLLILLYEKILNLSSSYTTMVLGKQPLVVIIVANYNGESVFYKNKNILWHCLNSLIKTKYDNLKLIVADDSSTDKSILFIKKKFPHVEVLSTKTNGGFSKNFNNAVKIAINKYKPKYIASFNNDIIVTDPLWLKKMLEDINKHGSVGMIGCKLLYDNNRIQHAGMIINYACMNRGRGEFDKGQYNKKEILNAVSGAVILIKKDVFDKIGLFDENFFMGCEDVDFCLRMGQEKLKILYDGNISFIHLEGQTSTNLKSKNLKLRMFYFSQRNFIYLILKHYRYFKHNLLRSIISYFGSALFSIEAPNRERKLINIRLKGNKIHRLYLSITGILDAIKIIKK